MEHSKPRSPLVFSGIQPSRAQVHIGNYLGAMRNFVSLAKTEKVMVCVVDLHAMTSLIDPKALFENTISLTAAYLAIGLDPKQTTIFRQSDVSAVCELQWYLACLFPYGLLERAHAFKDKKAKATSVNAGLVFYPILMAADMLLYHATKVPVGADQKQHIEMTRDVAASFNHRYGEIFTLPEPLIGEDVGVIPGLDGRKMSKSYDNYIGLFETDKEIKTKISKIVTDSKGVEEKKDYSTCNVFQLYKFFAEEQEIALMKDRYQQGGYGYGHAKQELANVMLRELSPIREKYQYWVARPDEIIEILRDGAQKARQVAENTMLEVRNAVGVRQYL